MGWYHKGLSGFGFQSVALVIPGCFGDNTYSTPVGSV